MNWIKCTDKLPSIGQDILMYGVSYQDDELSVFAGRYQIKSLLLPNCQFIEFNIDENGYFHTIPENVICWQPYPEPPEEIIDDEVVGVFS